MKRVTIIARGEVQRVNYRDEVERIARKLKLTGYVKNLKPYDVMVVAEGDEVKLKEFIKLIKINKYPILVEKLEVEWSNATGEFSYFEIIRGEWQEELFERFDVAGKVLYEIRDGIYRVEAGVYVVGEKVDVVGKKVDVVGKKVDAVGEKVDVVGKKVDAVGEKVDVVGKKVDAVGEKVDAVGEKVDVVGKKVDAVGEKVDAVGEKVDAVGEKVDAVGEKVDAVGEKVDKISYVIREESGKTRAELGGRIDMLRSDLKEYMELNFKKLSDELTDMRKEFDRLKQALRKAGISV
jgi:acylphosphatase/uncharacterized coiled-coil DUF342 family protein